MKSPCLECEERYHGCHGKCREYAAYRESCTRMSESRRNYRNDDATQMLIEEAIRQAKRK